MAKPNGRPKIEIDWDLVDKLCMIRCTQAEIASLLGINVDTLTVRCQEDQGKTFPEYFADKSAKGTMSLRRAQYVAAVENLDSTMLKHLGQHWLGQKPTDTQANLITHIAISMNDIKKAMGDDAFIDAPKKEIEEK